MVGPVRLVKGKDVRKQWRQTDAPRHSKAYEPVQTLPVCRERRRDHCVVVHWQPSRHGAVRIGRLISVEGADAAAG